MIKHFIGKDSANIKIIVQFTLIIQVIKSNMSFTNKVVLVTGASSGIGAAIAILFAKEGAQVVLVGRNEIKLKNVSEKCEKVGKKKPLILQANVAKDDVAKIIIDKTVEAFGKLDVLVNNAGIMRQGSILGGKILQGYDEMMSVNLRAVIHLTSLAAPYLAKTKVNIVNISSIAGIKPPHSPEYICYCVSKAGLDHFTRGAAMEFASSGVRVNSVNPGPVRSDLLENAGAKNFDWDSANAMTALGRVSEPEEIADLVMYLASDKARGITGSIFVADNGSIIKS